MGISGLIGAGASDSLDEVIIQQLAKQKFAEQVRAQQAQESIQQARLAQDAQQHGDVIKLRGREQDFRETQANEEMQQAGIADMRAQQEKQRVNLTRLNTETSLDDLAQDSTVPPQVRRMVDLMNRSGGAVKPGAIGPEDMASPEEQQAATEADIANYARKMGAGANAQAAAAARYREPKPTGPGGLSAGQLTSAKQFQDDYYRDSKTYVTVRNAYQQVAGAAQNPDAAGDLSLIFGYMKMLDPNSVVRETEFANAQNAAGVPDQVRNIYNRAMSGERLNPNQRKQFVGQANRIMKSAHDNQQRVRKTYGTRAEKFGIDPTMVLDDDEPMPGASASPAAAPAAAPTRRIKMDRNGNPIKE